MASIYSAYAYQVNGWCRGCGRKRNRDGSCSNCDHWYNSPLLLAGGPLVLATIALLAVGITALRPAGTSVRRAGTDPALLGAARRSPSSAPRIMMPAGAPASFPPLGGVLSAAVPQGGVGFSYNFVGSVAEEEQRRRSQAQFLQLESLRYKVAYADSVVRADDYAQEAAADATSPRAPRALSGGNRVFETRVQ